MKPVFKRSVSWLGQHGPTRLAGICLLLLALLGVGPRDSFGAGSSSKSPSPLAQKGIRHAEDGRYRQAINALEDAWELDPTDTVVAEHLARSYLYEKHPPGAAAIEKAEKLMRFALDHDGQASVPASHLHRGVQWATTVDSTCPGRLVLKPDGLHFLASADPHSFFIPVERLAAISLPKDRPKHAGIIILDTKADKRHRLRTGTHTRAEAHLLVRLTRSLILGG